MKALAHIRGCDDGDPMTCLKTASINCTYYTHRAIVFVFPVYFSVSTNDHTCNLDRVHGSELLSANPGCNGPATCREIMQQLHP